MSKILVKGIGASVGTATGKVVILKNSKKDSQRLNLGDILVATLTAPKLVPLMKKAGAIVTDKGGLLCHAAIITRELRIPCVVGTENATKKLKNGSTVTVDGTKGTVSSVG